MIMRTLGVPAKDFARPTVGLGGGAEFCPASFADADDSGHA
jgi:hypothetical protein